MAEFDYIFQRLHPQVEEFLEVWKHADKAYSGGKDYTDEYLIKHVSECDLEFNERKQRIYYLNYPQKIARQIAQYVTAQEPQRDGARIDIVEDFSRNGLNVDDVFKQAGIYQTCYGKAWIIVDNPSVETEKITEAQRIAGRIRPYGRALKPWQVTDWDYDADGKLRWAIVEERFIDKQNPFTQPKCIIQRRLWERDKWTLFQQESTSTDLQNNSYPDNSAPQSFVKMVAQKAHNIGEVPLILIEDPEGMGAGARPWFDDVVRISDAMFNCESEIEMNILKQMFGLLVVSASFYQQSSDQSIGYTDGNGESQTTFATTLARSTALWETEAESGITRYIAPNGAETKAISDQIQRLKKELYDVVGLAIQSESKQSQTAESKAWDNLNIQQFLISRVDMLEQAEKKAWELMNKWDRTVPIPEIKYNREFAVVDVEKTISALIDLDTVIHTEEGKRNIQRVSNQQLARLGRVTDESAKKMNTEVDNLTIAMQSPEVSGNNQIEDENTDEEE